MWYLVDDNVNSGFEIDNLGPHLRDRSTSREHAQPDHYEHGFHILQSYSSAETPNYWIWRPSIRQRPGTYLLAIEMRWLELPLRPLRPRFATGCVRRYWKSSAGNSSHLVDGLLKSRDGEFKRLEPAGLGNDKSA